MAKKYIDAAVADSKDDMSTADGTALTLTNSVRVLYDDTVPKADLINLLERATDKIRESIG